MKVHLFCVDLPSEFYTEFMYFKKILSSLGILAILYSCSDRGKMTETAQVPDLQGSISVSGAFALYPLAVQWGNAFEEMHPGVRVDISAGGAGKGMTDVINGMVDFAMMSRDTDGFRGICLCKFDCYLFTIL